VDPSTVWKIVKMEGISEVLVIIGMFALRLGVPLLIILVVGYLLRRLDSRWEAEARAEAQTRREMEAALQIPCWEDKGCPPEDYRQCPGYQYSHLPCWLARLRAQSRLPADCPDCPRYASSKGRVPA